NLGLHYIRATRAAAKVIVIESPDSRAARPIRPKLEILVLAQALVVVADATFHSDDPFAIGKKFNMAGALGTRLRINGKIDPAAIGSGQRIPVLNHRDLVGAGRKLVTILGTIILVMSNKRSGLVGVGTQPDGGLTLAAMRPLAFLDLPARHEIGFNGHEELAFIVTESEERTEITLGPSLDLALPLRDQIAVIVLGQRLLELDGKAEPHALLIGHSELGALPDLGPFAAQGLALRAQRFHREPQGTFAAIDHLVLELDGPGALFVILLVIEAAFRSEVLAF